MTRSYFVISDQWGQASITSDTVVVEDNEPKFTGLVNEKGDPIFAQEEKLKLGFDITDG